MFRKTVLGLMMFILTLWAVEWNLEQITDDAERWNTHPVLTTHAMARPWVLFAQRENIDLVHLKAAVRDTDWWFIKDVADVGEFSPYYGIDGTGQGSLYVVYTDTAGAEDTELFLASDDDIDFSVSRLTDDLIDQKAPVVKLDNTGNVHLIYVQEVDGDDQLFYGWIDSVSQDFNCELVTHNLYQHGMDFDLVFNADNVPYVFYTGDDEYLWFATSGEPAWFSQNLNELSSRAPSAAVDQSGGIHLAYAAGESSIRYLTNKTGDWVDEEVSGPSSGWTGDDAPSLALDSYGNVHITWLDYETDWHYDISYASNSTGAWVEEPVTATDDFDELPGYRRSFIIDGQNYGHLAFFAEDENSVFQVYRLGSSVPLTSAVAEPITQPITHPVTHPETQPCFEIVRSVGSRIQLVSTSQKPQMLNIFDASGRIVDELVLDSQATWGDGFGPGVYFVREVSGGSPAQKVVLVR